MNQQQQQQQQQQLKPCFDYAPSILPLHKGEGAQSLPCTPEIFEAMLASPLVAAIQKQIEELMKRVTRKTTPEQFRTIKEQVNALKKKLPVIIPGGHSLTGFRKINSDSDFILSPFVTLDIDGVDDPEELFEKIRPYIESLMVALVFITPSTRGLKLIAKRPKNLTPTLAMAWLAGELGIENYDKSVKDPLRAHYLAPNSNVRYYNKERLFGAEATNEGYYVTPKADLLLEKIDHPDDEGDAAEAPVSSTAVKTATAQTTTDLDLTYLGLPLTDYVTAYWEVNNDGRTPCVGDRNTKTFELAKNLRYICDNNEAVLCAVIPCYAGFSEEEKRATIHSAVGYDMRQMPYKMLAVLTAMKAKHAENQEMVQAVEELEELSNTNYIKQFKETFTKYKAKVPMGIIDSFEGVQENLQFPILIGIGPFIGGLATQVQLNVHDEYSYLNLSALIVGEAASGKSKMDALYRVWLQDLIKADDVNIRIMEEWKALPAKTKEKTPRPVVPILIQPLRCSTADLLDHLNNANGRHLISFGSEADQLTNSRRSGIGISISVMKRNAYDNAELKSSYAGSNSVCSNVKELKWNITMCTTPCGLHRAIPCVTDGEMTREAIARTPDNTFAPLIRVKPRSEAAQERIHQIASLLQLMEGKVELPLLEEAAFEWLEKERIESLKDGDKTRARLRMRSVVTAMRYTCCIMLCAYAEWLLKKLDHRRSGAALPKWAHGAATAQQYLSSHKSAVEEQLPKLMQQPVYLECLPIIADYLVDNTLFYFRRRIEAATEKEDYQGGGRHRAGANDTIFDQLGEKFTLEEARRAKGQDSTDNAAKQMMKNWRKQGLIKSLGNGVYEKLQELS